MHARNLRGPIESVPRRLSQYTSAEYSTVAMSPSAQYACHYSETVTIIKKHIYDSVRKGSLYASGMPREGECMVGAEAGSCKLAEQSC